MDRSWIGIRRTEGDVAQIWPDFDPRSSSEMADRLWGRKNRSLRQAIVAFVLLAWEGVLTGVVAVCGGRFERVCAGFDPPLSTQVGARWANFGWCTGRIRAGFDDAVARIVGNGRPSLGCVGQAGPDQDFRWAKAP